MAAFRACERPETNEDADTAVCDLARPSAVGALLQVRRTMPRLKHLMMQTIEADVVPRLVMARRVPVLAVGTVRGDTPNARAENVVEFTQVVLTRPSGAVSAFVETMRANGATAENVYVDLLTPTARRMGDLWVADLCSFADVTLGLLRLQNLMRTLSPTFQSEKARQWHGRQVLLLPQPGEQHTFGLLMVAEFFQRAGWDVWSRPLESATELGGIVRKQWFAVAGLSISSERHLDALSLGIRDIRRDSRNPAIAVMVGGSLFAEHPELVTQVGADATAADGLQATMRAEDLLSRVLPARA